MRIDNDPLKKWGAERDGLSRYCGGGKNGLVTGAPRPIKWFADRLRGYPSLAFRAFWGATAARAPLLPALCGAPPDGCRPRPPVFLRPPVQHGLDMSESAFKTGPDAEEAFKTG